MGAGCWRWLPCARCCDGDGDRGICGVCDGYEAVVELSGFAGDCPGRCNLNGAYAATSFVPHYWLWLMEGCAVPDHGADRCRGFHVATLPWEPCYSHENHPVTVYIRWCFTASGIVAQVQAEGLTFPSSYGILFAIAYALTLPDPLPEDFDCAMADLTLEPTAVHLGNILYDPWLQQFPGSFKCSSNDLEATRLRLVLSDPP